MNGAELILRLCLSILPFISIIFFYRAMSS